MSAEAKQLSIFSAKPEWIMTVNNRECKKCGYFGQDVRIYSDSSMDPCSRCKKERVETQQNMEAYWRRMTG